MLICNYIYVGNDTENVHQKVKQYFFDDSFIMNEQLHEKVFVLNNTIISTYMSQNYCLEVITSEGMLEVEYIGFFSCDPNANIFLLRTPYQEKIAWMKKIYEKNDVFFEKCNFLCCTSAKIRIERAFDMKIIDLLQ